MKSVRILSWMIILALSTAAGCAGGPDEEPDDDTSLEEAGDGPGEASPMKLKAEPASCGECFRAIVCVEACGGPVVQASCCECPRGTFDAISCRLAE